MELGISRCYLHRLLNQLTLSDEDAGEEVGNEIDETVEEEPTPVRSAIRSTIQVI
jgi:hypothetical protein